VLTVCRVRATPDLEPRLRRRPPWYGLWWVWTLVVVVLLALVLLLGRRSHPAHEEDGLLYRVFQRAGGSPAKKPQ